MNLKKKIYSKKKNIDFLFYNRNHANKENKNIIKLLLKLKNRFDVRIVGDRLNGFNNYGIISRSKLDNILSRTKIVFGTSENIYSFFVIDAILNSCFVFLKDREKKNVKFFTDRFIFKEKKRLNNDYMFEKILNKKFFLYLKYRNKSFIKINEIEKKINLVVSKSFN